MKLTGTVPCKSVSNHGGGGVGVGFGWCGWVVPSASTQLHNRPSNLWFFLFGPLVVQVLQSKVTLLPLTWNLRGLGRPLSF